MRNSFPLFFLSRREQKIIETAIRQAEQNTSGEIRVHLVKEAKGDGFAQAKEVFEKIGMTRTRARNGVLIFLCVKSHKFIILGDRGIDEKVPPGFWQDITHLMADHFQHDRFAEGISEAVLKVGEKLKAFFPYEQSDRNELPDKISWSKD